MSRFSRLLIGLTGPLVLTAGCGAASSTAAPDPAAPVRIMVVGDSISQGRTGDYTWRYRLWQHLTADKVAFDLVGPRRTLWDPGNRAGTNLYVDPRFDQDHDAVWGQPVVHAKNTIAADVTRSNPDILLVDLGVDDMAWGYTDAADTAGNMAAFIANARSAHPDIKIVLTELTPRSSSVGASVAPLLDDYDARLVDLAKRVSTARSPVVIANPIPGFNPDVDTYDGTHPTPSGEVKIAAAFSDVLAHDFRIGRPFGARPAAPAWPLPPTALSATPGNGQMTLTWTPAPGADNYYVYQRDVTAGLPFQRLRYPVRARSFTGSYLANGHTYEFALAAARGNVVGPRSRIARVTPGSELRLPQPAN